MPIVTMPDGTQVEMPDEVTPELGQRLRAFNTFKQLGGTRKADQPGYTFFPSGVTYRHADQKFWLPAASSWFSAGAQGLISEGQAQMPETQEARDQAQLALEASKGLPTATPQMMSSHTTPSGGVTEIIPGMRSGAIGREQSPLREFGQQLYQHGRRTSQEATAGLLHLAGKSLPIGEGSQTGTVYGEAQNPLLGAASGISNQIASEPVPEAKTTLGKAGAVIGGVLPHMTPLAPVTMGASMYESGYQGAKARGADEASAQLSGIAQGGIGATIGAAGRITKATTKAIAPYLATQYPALWSALTKEVAIGGKGPVSKFLSDLFVGSTKTAVDFTAMGAANDAIAEAAAPSGGSPLSAAADLNRRLEDIKMGIAFHAVPAIVGAAGKGLRELAGGREIGGVKAEGKGVAPEPPAPRTADQIRAEAAEAARKGDITRAEALDAELEALSKQAPSQAPLEGEIVPREGATPVGPEGTVFKGTSPYGLVKAGAEPTPIVEGEVTRPAIGAKERPALGMAERIPERPGTAEGAGFNDRINQLQTNLDADSKRLMDLQNQLGIEQDRFKRTKSQKARSNIEQIENLVYDLEQSTRDQQDRITQMKSRRPTAIEPAKGIEVPERELTAEDQTRISELQKEREAVTKSLDEAQSREEIDRLTNEQNRLDDEISKVQLGVEREAPTPSAEEGGLTPQGSGTALLSNEELARSQRGDTYYRVDRSGRVTNLGPQPDATVRNGEAVVMVNGRTGKPQVQNSQGLGDDTAVLSKFGNRVMQVHTEAESGRISKRLDSYKYTYTPDAENISSKKWFHGTSASDLASENIDPWRTKAEGLLGPGLYLTDRESVAGSGYAKARGKHSPGFTYEATIKPRNIIDMEKTMPNDVYEIYKRALESVDAEVPSNSGSGISVYRKMMEELADAHLSSDTVQEIQTEANSQLQFMGYDGFTHEGGKLTSSKPHQVVVLFNPSDAFGEGHPNPIQAIERRGHNVIADNLGLQQMYEAGMNKAKEALGLERAATDGEVVRAIGQKIGRLGATVKETAVRIMNQIKGIGRDLANAIAEHLHQAVSGSRESQLGAVGEKPKYTPEEEAHYQSKADRARELIAKYLPGEENKAARAEAYSKLPSKAGVIAEYRRGAEPTPEPAPKYNRLEGFAKSSVQPLVDAPKVARALISGDNTATNRVWDLLQKREVLPQAYKEGSLETPKIVRPLIFGEDLPTIVKDFKENILGGGAKATFNRFMRSPHNLEEPVFGKYNTPTQDLQMSVVSAMHNRNNLSNYFRDLLRTTKVKDNSVEMQAEAKPVFERFQKIAAEMEPLQAQRSDLEKTFGDLKKAGKDTTEAKNALRDWDSAHAQRLSTLEAEMGAVQNEHQKMLRDFASKYGDARVALAAEYDVDKVPSWIKLSAEEKKAADGMRDSMRSIKDSLDRVGIPTLDENYVTHLTKYLAPETAGTFERRTPREVLKFAPRAEDSSQWLPSVHAAVADYIPNVSRKLATQEFYNKWRSMIDPKDPNSLSNPASPNYAPNASLYLEGMFKSLDTPEALNFFDKAVNTLRDYENMKLLAANVRVGWKHAAGKLPSILAQHDVWTAPGALGQAKALVGKLSETNPIRTAVDKLGGKTVDWAKKAELVSYFANTREILGMLRENPFTSGVEEARKLGVGGAGTNKAMRTIFGDRAPDALAKFHRGIQKVTSNPVAAVEAWENGLDLLTSIEKGHAKGLEDPQNVKAFLNNILDFNFRGGADSPRLIKDPRTRYFIQFAQTPMKLAELKAKLIANAWKGGKDIYGTDHTANLVKHVLTIGVAFAVAKELGVNVKDSILHLPFLNSDQWGRIAKMAYYGTKGNLLDDPAARRKFNDTKAAFIGEKMPAVMGSPVFDIAKDVKTVLAAGPMGIVKQSPVYNQLKAILNGKPPKGFDSVPAYLTGERSHRSMEDMERRAIREGRKQIKYEQKLERNR